MNAIYTAVAGFVLGVLCQAAVTYFRSGINPWGKSGGGPGEEQKSGGGPGEEQKRKTRTKSGGGPGEEKPGP